MTMLDKLKSTDFLPYLNQNFLIRLEEIEPIALELVSVTEMGQPSTPGLRAPFSLLFLGPVSEQFLIQHIYRLEHDSMGSFDIFIVPLGLRTGRMQYEAIFS